MPDGRVEFEISGDNRSLRQTLSDTTSAIQRESRNWDRATDESSGNMQKAFSKAFDVERVKNFALAAGKALLQFSKEAVQAASDLSEVQNVVDATFGNSARQIDEWSKSAIKSYGLTETQAKRFASTIGAMAKSAGMAGPEIVQMSSDLAGLAADMASFYNMDFDTAFQKLRSGVSGQTMPLKELGINMSEASLAAFALQQGLSKTVSQMSQSEQMMLRYQYIMQATADAQGDFARTNDGFANGVRLLQSNIESLKAKFGELLEGPLANVIASLNTLWDDLNPPEKTTVLDDLAAIDLDTGSKLKNLESTTAQAQKLIDILGEIDGFTLTDGGEAAYVEGLANGVNTLQNAKPRLWKGLIDTLDDATIGEGISAETGTALTDVANGANALNDTASGRWEKLEGSVKGFTVSDDLKGSSRLGTIATDANSLGVLTPDRWDKLMTALKDAGALSGLADAGTNLDALSRAINSDGASTEKAEAWKTLLGALAGDAEALSGLTGESAEGTKAWLETLAQGANALSPESAEGWDKLKQSFLEGFTPPEGEGDGVFASFFGASDEYSGYLAALGIQSDAITDKQQLWLHVCRQLAQTIPGLSSIIDMETGEVEGGVQALQDYLDTWHENQRQMILLEDLAKRRQALSDRYADRYALEAELMVAEYDLEQAQAALAQHPNANSYTEVSKYNLGLPSEHVYQVRVDNAQNTRDKALKAYTDYVAGFNAETAKLDKEERVLTEDFGETAVAAALAGDAIGMTADQASAAETALGGLTGALTELNDYYEAARQNTEASVNSVISGFGEIITPAEKARSEYKALNKELAGLSDAEIDIRMAGEGVGAPSAQNMLAGLQDQMKYIQEYQQMLSQAHIMGYSDQVLAALSDGSTESYDYLKALTSLGAPVEEINDAYAAVEEGKSTFTDALTQQKLAADETFQGIMDKANEMVTALDMADGAADAMSSTVEGMANGIAAALPDLQAQVDAVVAQLTRLDSFGSFGWMAGQLIGGVFGMGGILDGSNEKGLDYVPFDGYLSELHEGESVLTAEEARLWRNFKYGGAAQMNAIDYDALGGVMRDNVVAGGNVYLEGRTVGKVLSASQANSYRSLERSGWQG